MIFLRQSTASQEIPLGRFVDSADGDTEKTALTIANTDIKIWKTGATTLANKNSGGATHIANGEYYCVLDATDTDTIGPLKVTIHVAGALYVQVFCTVLDEAVYDVLFGTTALATVSNITAGTITTATNVTTVNGLAAGVITAAAIATGAIDADALAADAGTEIGTAVWATATRSLTVLDEDSTTLDLDATIRAAVGLASASLDTQLDALPTAAENQSGMATAANLATVAGYLDTEIAAILADTNELQTDWVNGGRLDLILDARASQTSVDTVDGIVDDILVDTGTTLPATLATIAGYIDTEIASILAAVDTEVAAILADTGTDGVVLSSATLAAIADAILDRNMATGTDSGSTTVRTPRQALRALRNKVSVSAGTMTVTKEDDSTSSWTGAVTTDATADPITAIDPAGP